MTNHPAPTREQLASIDAKLKHDWQVFRAADPMRPWDYVLGFVLVMLIAAVLAYPVLHGMGVLP